MNRNGFAIIFVFVLTALACSPKQTLTGNTFGEAITNVKYVDFKTMLANLKDKDEIQTTVRAKVVDVCKAKGCWMTLTQDGSDQEMMVQFKDYGFFVPKDISGREVVIQGKAFKSITPVKELQHYAKDAGKSKEEIAAITEPEETLNFEATGVMLVEQ